MSSSILVLLATAVTLSSALVFDGYSAQSERLDLAPSSHDSSKFSIPKHAGASNPCTLGGRVILTSQPSGEVLVVSLGACVCRT